MRAGRGCSTCEMTRQSEGTYTVNNSMPNNKGSWSERCSDTTCLQFLADSAMRSLIARPRHQW